MTGKNTRRGRTNIMKNKMNWGGWIVVSFIVFIAGTAVMVSIAMRSSVDLVTEDYYEKELRYQDHIEVVKNTNALPQQVSLEYAPTGIRVIFPKLADANIYSGSVRFFRPSDKRGDFSAEIKLDSSMSQQVPLTRFTVGLWRAKIDWQVGSQRYYSELPVIIQ